MEAYNVHTAMHSHSTSMKMSQHSQSFFDEAWKKGVQDHCYSRWDKNIDIYSKRLSLCCPFAYLFLCELCVLNSYL